MRGGIHLGSEQVLSSMTIEVDGVLLDVDVEALVHGEIEDRDKVVPQGRNVKDIGKFNLLRRDTIDNRFKQDSTYTL